MTFARRSPPYKWRGSNNPFGCSPMQDQTKVRVRRTASPCIVRQPMTKTAPRKRQDFMCFQSYGRNPGAGRRVCWSPTFACGRRWDGNRDIGSAQPDRCRSALIHRCLAAARPACPCPWGHRQGIGAAAVVRALVAGIGMRLFTPMSTWPSSVDPGRDRHDLPARGDLRQPTGQSSCPAEPRNSGLPWQCSDQGQLRTARHRGLLPT